MRGYGERDFVKALVPQLIGRLPDPFTPTAEDMRRVADAAVCWAALLADLREQSRWSNFVLDIDGPTWSEADR